MPTIVRSVTGWIDSPGALRWEHKELCRIFLQDALVPKGSHLRGGTSVQCVLRLGSRDGFYASEEIN